MWQYYVDVARNNAMRRLSSLLQFVKNSEHTNVIIMDAPHRFDMGASSCVNKEVNAFNRKKKKTTRPCYHTGQINLNIHRDNFTKHGMHMNGSSKDSISGLLTSRIMELFTTHHHRTPPALPWKVKTTHQSFSTFVRPRPGKFFFIKWGPSPNKFTCKYLSNVF